MDRHPQDNRVNGIQNLLSRAVNASPDKRAKYVANALKKRYDSEHQDPAFDAMSCLIYSDVIDMIDQYWETYGTDSDWVSNITYKSSASLNPLEVNIVRWALPDVAKEYQLPASEQKLRDAIEAELV